MKNEKGVVIFLVIMFSTLLLIGSAAVYSMISGRFSITRHINRKIQAMRDAETASYVANQMLMEGNWTIPSTDKRVRLLTPDGSKTRTYVNVDLSESKVSGCQPIKLRAEY